MLNALPETFRDVQADLALARMMKNSPSLRARRFEKRLHWMDGLVPLIAPRVTSTNPPLAAAAIVSACLSCVDLTSDAWAEADGNADIVTLYDTAIAALHEIPGTS